MAIDLGATYKLNDEWTFSASLLDLGFISWKNTTKGTMNKDFTFDGFSDISVKDDGTDNNKKLDTQVDELVDDLADLAKFDKAGEGLKRTDRPCSHPAPGRSIYPARLRPLELRLPLHHPHARQALMDGSTRFGKCCSPLLV